MPRHHEPQNKHGFTLVEILVALMIFALAFGLLAQIMQTGLRQSTGSRSMAAATFLAKSEVARVGVEVPLQVGHLDGETEYGMGWRTEIELIEGPSEHQGLATYQVQVTVTWGASPAEQLTLTTLRIGFPPE